MSTTTATALPSLKARYRTEIIAALTEEFGYTNPTRCRPS